MNRNDGEKNGQVPLDDLSSIKARIVAKRSPDFSSSTLRRVTFGRLR